MPNSIPNIRLIQKKARIKRKMSKLYLLLLAWTLVFALALLYLTAAKEEKKYNSDTSPRMPQSDVISSVEIEDRNGRHTQIWR